MSKVLCKFRVTEITEVENSYRGHDSVQLGGKVGGSDGGRTAKRIKLAAVMGEPFGPATPQGAIDMFIVNSAASEHFLVGQEYFVTFQRDDGSGAS